MKLFKKLLEIFSFMVDKFQISMLSLRRVFLMRLAENMVAQSAEQLSLIEAYYRFEPSQLIFGCFFSTEVLDGHIPLTSSLILTKHNIVTGGELWRPRRKS
jgi:hypothetical protein